MAMETRPFYIDLNELEFREFAQKSLLLEDEFIVLEAYADYARANETLNFSAARVTDALVARGEEFNIPKLRTLPNVRRLMAQTAYTLRDKNFLDLDIEEGEVTKFYLKDPLEAFLNDYYSQMLSNLAMPFPDVESISKYLVPQNSIELPVSDIASGQDHRLQEEKRLIIFNFNEMSEKVCVTAKTIDNMLEVCFLKLKNVVISAAQNRLGEDLVKDMQHLMPQKTTSIERIGRILSRIENETPLYVVNLANRLAAYFTIDKEKKGMLTLIQAARLVEGFKSYDAWLESEKNNQNKIKENAMKIVNRMADFPELLSRNGIIQKVLQGASGLEGLKSILNANDTETMVNQMLADYTVFQADERELLPAIIKIRVGDEDFFIHREAVLIFFESERKRVRTELLSRFRKLWYALMLRNASRSSMEFDEFFAEDVAKYVRNHEPILSAFLSNPQLIVNAFHVVSRHAVSSNLQNHYFIFGNRVIFKLVHSLLELDRREIYAQVRSELPFLFRYPFLRWLLSIFGIGSTNQQQEVEIVENEKPAHGQTVLQDTEWHRILAMVETKFIGEKNVSDTMRKLEDTWNLKLGDTRKQLQNRVQREIATRAKRLYSMTRKLPEVSQNFMANEVSNVASQIVRLIGNDSADRNALGKFVELGLLEELKTIHT
ncbi:MAG: hypothetical protein LDLANPLL_02321 [Turneriella sp.]|nr:hypothetical protein [Turneriella sp.]